MRELSDCEERRRYPRALIYLPVHFQVFGESTISTGLAINVSEVGLLIQTFEDMPIGKEIDIKVLFPKSIEFVNFRAVAEIIWKDIFLFDDWEGYKYGLKFIRIITEDYLRRMLSLSHHSELEELSFANKANRKGH